MNVLSMDFAYRGGCLNKVAKINELPSPVFNLHREQSRAKPVLIKQEEQDLVMSDNEEPPS
jgi:hypothetical protein